MCILYFYVTLESWELVKISVVMYYDANQHMFNILL